MLTTSLGKNYSSLLSSKNWPKVEHALLRNTKDFKSKESLENFRTILANTRHALVSDTTLQNMSYLPKLILPLVRRVWPNLIANELVSIQPLKGPTGVIRFLDVYNKGVDGTTTNLYPWRHGKGTEYSTPQNILSNDVLPLASAASNTSKTFAGALSKIPSEGTAYLEMCVNDDATNPQWVRVARFDKQGIIQNMYDSDVIIGAVAQGDRNYTVAFVNTAPKHALRISYRMDIQKNVPFGGQGTGGTANGQGAGGDFYPDATGRFGQTYNTLNFNISRIPVEAKTRKLGANYTFEIIEDYQAEFGEKFEDRIVDYLHQTILTEIDAEILDMLFNSAHYIDTWDCEMPAIWTRGINAWYETIMPKINLMSNTIYAETHVQNGSRYLVCHPQTATIFQSMIQYQGAGNPITDSSMSVGTVKLGTINNMYTVYSTPLAPVNEILIGFKGVKPEETGCIYAPYVPIMLTPVTYSEVPSLMARTRYALEMIRPAYYGIIRVSGNLGSVPVSHLYTTQVSGPDAINP